MTKQAQKHCYLVSYVADGGKIVGHINIYLDEKWKPETTANVVDFMKSEDVSLGDHLAITNLFYMGLHEHD